MNSITNLHLVVYFYWFKYCHVVLTEIEGPKTFCKSSPSRILGNSQDTYGPR
jgi:hypothetical protein